MKSEHRRRLRGWVTRGLIISVIAVLLIAGVWATLALGTPSSSRDRNQPIAPVQRGPLVIAVVQSGTIKARQQEILKSELEGQNVILYLIPEGTMVKKGQLLAELDASKLQDSRIEKSIQVQNAEAAFIRARENMEVVRNQTKADVAKAELDFQFAKEDLKKYMEGDFPKEKMGAENKITLSQEEFQRAADKFEWSEKLFNAKYLSKTELKADELARNKANLDLQLATADLNLLTNWTYKRNHDQFQSNVEQTQMALERVTRKASADIVQAEAELKAKEAEFDRQKGQLAKIDRQISMAKIVAPTDGMAVYATTGQGWGRQEPLQEGQSVRERQDIIYLPTATEMMAEIKVHESTLDKVTPGLPVQVTVDAIPGKSYTGRVAKIAPLPDQQSVFQNPDLKVYNTIINLDGDGTGLRTGMTCKAQIIVEQHQDVVYVPVQSVIRVNGQPTVYVSEGNVTRRVPIELGLDDNKVAHVISGLTVGQQVLLNPPLADATAAAEPLTFAQATTLPSTRPAPAAADGAGTDPAQSPGNDGAAPDGQAGPRGERGAGGPGGGGAGGGGGGGWGNMTPEQRDEMRKRMEAMSPEEREAMRSRWRKGGSNSEGGGAGGGAEGGAGRGTEAGPGGAAGGERRSGGWGNMTPEQRDEMRKKFEAMSPEEREAMRNRWRQGGSGGGGAGGGGAGSGGGGEGGGAPGQQ